LFNSADKNKVNVNFSVYIQDKKQGVIQELEETHGMRYLFEPEITSLCKKNNIEVVACEEWVTGKKPVSSSWGVCVVGKKR